MQGAVTFTPCTNFDAGATVVVACPLTYQLVLGSFTTGDLVPGCYIVVLKLECHNCPEQITYTVNVPDDPDPQNLWDLILAPLPVSVVEYVQSLAGLSGVITLEQLLALIPPSPPDMDISFATTVGDGTTGPFVIVHALGSTDVQAQFRDLPSGFEVGVAWRVVDANTISVEPDDLVALNSLRAYIVRVVN